MRSRPEPIKTQTTTLQLSRSKISLFLSMDSFSCGSDFNPSASQQAASNNESFATVTTRPPKRRAGRKKFRETRHPVYKGIRRKNHGKWVCEIREPSKQSRIWLGTFPTAEMAARAHDVAAIALRGRSACLNFADSAQLLPVPASTDAKDIQKAAAEAAEAFRPASQWNGISEIGAVSADHLIDEEAFDEIRLIDSMAEGLMLSPPWSVGRCDDVEGEADVLLWNHSI